MTFRRHFNPVLLASLFFAVTAPAWGETWRGIDIDTSGWIPVSKDDESYILFRDDPQQGRNKRAWERFEVSQPKNFSSFSTRSATALLEFDCVGGRYRTLQETSYAENNLKGEQRDGEPVDWSYVIPGSNADDMFKRECSSE